MSGARGRGGAARGGKKPAVAYTAPREPDFIRKIKEKMGYKAPATLEDKRAKLEQYEEGEGGDCSKDEGPLIVQLREGDLSAEEVDRLKLAQGEVDEKEKIEKGEIQFRKPENKKRPADDLGEELAEKARKMEENQKLEPPPPRLLSFGEDEEEDDD